MDRELIAARQGSTDWQCSDEPHLVLEAGHAEVEKVQQAVELRHRQVVEPLLQHQLVSVLQHPQQADEKAAAGLGQEAAVLTSRLGGRWRAGISTRGRKMKSGDTENSFYSDKTGATCELSRKLLGRDIGVGVEVPAIAMATVWLMRLLPSPSVSSPPPPTTAPWGPPGRPHWLCDSGGAKERRDFRRKSKLIQSQPKVWTVFSFILNTSISISH